MMGLLEFLGIGRSKENAFFGPQQERARPLIVLDWELSAFSWIDCLHELIIVDALKQTIECSKLPLIKIVSIKSLGYIVPCL